MSSAQQPYGSDIPEFRGRIYNSVLETIGATPLIRIEKMAKQYSVKGDIVVKCEFYNPMGSVKDRIGRGMIEAAEAEGRLRPGTVIVEPTSGNTGIALAFICAAKGYRLILTMPESMSVERRKMLRLLGAELELTPPTQGMRGAISRAEALVKELPDAIMLQQFQNPANPAAHHATTAEEIWTDTAGKIDVVISGVGTGGTLTGIGQALRPRRPSLKMIAVEPNDSPVLSGGTPGPHKIQGIGAGFVPDILDVSQIDEVIRVSNENAFKFAREVAKVEGLPVGISSGAAIAAAIEIGVRDEMAGKLIVAIVPSFAERYLSTALFEGL